MPTLTIRDVPSELLAQLKARAAANHRSLNGEVLAILTVGTHLVRTPDEVNALRQRLADLRARLPLLPLTLDDLERAKTEGRT